MPINALIIANYFSLLQKNGTLYIYNCKCKRERGSSTPLTAASFCARGALRGACYAPSTKLYAPTSQICTRPCPLYAPQMHLHYPHYERDPVCILASCSTRPLQRRPPARCSLSLPRDEDCSGRQREARTRGERLGRLVDERRRPKRQRPRLLAPPTPMDGMQDKIFFKNLDRINFRLI